MLVRLSVRMVSEQMMMRLTFRHDLSINVENA